MMEIEAKPSNEIISLNAIRVETALSRYPVHRLAKKGEISIEISDDNRETALQWKVSNNSEYGQPGPLAYKLDTLIINRRIEESYRPISRLIKLGSLHDICKELGISEGKNKTAIKNSLYQNASVFIRAKIRFKSADGAERTLEAGFNRYNVIFTGERLPDGRKADGVYIILSDVFIQVLNGATTRPLDYDYLKSLAPGPQRFYELLSYQMYAALKYDRPRAKLTYSDFCDHAPQMRHLEWARVRSQMNKLHVPHKESGYIAKIDYEQTVSRDGKPDWIMLYQPGAKARDEFRAFNKRGGPSVVEIEPFELTQSAFPSLTGPAPTIVQELIDRGVSPEAAMKLEASNALEAIQRQIEHYDWLMEGNAKKSEKPDGPGWLVKAILGKYSLHKKFKTKAQIQQEEEVKQTKKREAGETRRLKQEAEAREKAEKLAIAAYWDSLSTQEQEALDEAATAQADPATLQYEIGPMKTLGKSVRREAYIRATLEKSGKFPL